MFNGPRFAALTGSSGTLLPHLPTAWIIWRPKETHKPISARPQRIYSG